MFSDIENSMLFIIQSIVLVVPKNIRYVPRDLWSRGTSEYVLKYAIQSGEVLDVLQLLEEMNNCRIGTPENV